jgi:hypothetical protein
MAHTRNAIVPVALCSVRILEWIPSVENSIPLFHCLVMLFSINPTSQFYSIEDNDHSIIFGVQEPRQS